MTPREQRITRKKMEKLLIKVQPKKKQELKRTTNNFIRQNTPSTTDNEAQPVVGEEMRPIINEDQRANEARKRSERQRKYRNKQLKKMEEKVSKLRTKLNTQLQKYKRVKKELKKIVVFFCYPRKMSRYKSECDLRL